MVVVRPTLPLDRRFGDGRLDSRSGGERAIGRSLPRAAAKSSATRVAFSIFRICCRARTVRMQRNVIVSFEQGRWFAKRVADRSLWWMSDALPNMPNSSCGAAGAKAISCGAPRPVTLARDWQGRDPPVRREEESGCGLRLRLAWARATVPCMGMRDQRRNDHGVVASRSEGRLTAERPSIPTRETPTGSGQRCARVLSVQLSFRGAQLSGMSSNRPGWNGFSARCSSRKKSVFRQPRNSRPGRSLLELTHNTKEGS